MVYGRSDKTELRRGHKHQTGLGCVKGRLRGFFSCEGIGGVGCFGRAS